jgi:hypothetical protein
MDVDLFKDTEVIFYDEKEKCLYFPTETIKGLYKLCSICTNNLNVRNLKEALSFRHFYTQQNQFVSETT